MKLKIDCVRYHRNGCHNAPFYLVAFRCRMQGERKERHLLATVFDEKTHLAVVEPTNPKNCWRSDHFESGIRAAIEEADKSGAAYDHTGTDN